MKYTISTLVIFSLSLFSLQAQDVKMADQTLNAGKLEWLVQEVNTGKIPFGIPTTREYVVKNVSDEMLLLKDVRTTCHCAVADWTKTPIAPGETAAIRITYDALRAGDFFKVAKVYTNFDPEHCVALVMRGTVEAKKD